MEESDGMENLMKLEPRRMRKERKDTGAALGGIPNRSRQIGRVGAGKEERCLERESGKNQKEGHCISSTNTRGAPSLKKIKLYSRRAKQRQQTGRKLMPL